MTRRRGLLVVLAIGLLVCGCEGEDSQALIDLALEWARENWASLALDAIGGTTGDEVRDAILDSHELLDDISKADRLMEEGRAEGNLQKMENAVEMRPGDYTYRVSYATELVKSGDWQTAREEYELTAQVLEDYPEDHTVAAARQSADELVALQPYFSQNGFQSDDHCLYYFTRLSAAYRTLGEAEGNQGYLDWSSEYAMHAEACVD